MPRVADAILMFAPELWGQVWRFEQFYRGTYSFEERDQRAVVGVSHHFQKSTRLLHLARKLEPNLLLDWQELEERGATSASNGEEVATVLEAAIQELYSTLDCMVKVLRAVYGPGSRGFKGSTRKFFLSVDVIAGTFPDVLKEAVGAATWFPRLLYLRDELTHLAAGRVVWDAQTGKARYDHRGVREAGKPLCIPDVFGWLDDLTASVNGLLDRVFHELNGTLSSDEQFQPCGMVHGRMLYRYVSPADAVSFHGGRCGAWVWFEKPDLPSCPFVQGCGAYNRKAGVSDGLPPQAYVSQAGE